LLQSIIDDTDVVVVDVVVVDDGSGLDWIGIDLL